MIVLSESASGLMATKMMLKERRGCAPPSWSPFVRPCGPCPLRGLHEPSEPGHMELGPGSPGLRTDRSGHSSRPPAQRSHREGAGRGPGLPLACHGVRVCTIACRRVRHWRMAAGIAAVCACPRASTR